MTGVSRKPQGHGSNIGRQHGITVIDGGCPCMFEPTADRGHKVMRSLLTITGKVPRRVAQTS